MRSQGRTVHRCPPNTTPGRRPCGGPATFAGGGRCEEPMIAHGDEPNAVGAQPDQRSSTAAGQRTIPEATVARLAIYLRVLGGMGENGTATVSSESLATAAGVNS